MATDIPPQVVVGPRYLVVRAGGQYQVVDTDTTGTGEGRVLTDGLTSTDASLIAEALNRQPVAQLEVAARALIELHQAVAKLYPSPTGRWAGHHADAATVQFVEQLQRQHDYEEPF